MSHPLGIAWNFEANDRGGGTIEILRDGKMITTYGVEPGTPDKRGHVYKISGEHWQTGQWFVQHISARNAKEAALLLGPGFI